MKILKTKKGEAYIDTSISILVIIFILIFCIFSLSLISKKIICDRISYSLCEKASVEGEINENVISLINYYKSIFGQNIEVIFDYEEYKDGKIQLGSEILCTVRIKNIAYPLLNESLYYNVSSSNVSLSKVYFK